MTVLEERSVAGIPLLFSPASGPTRGALAFRVGRGDERFARGGITHLVEHLALFRLGEVTYEFNAFVDDISTVFFAEGTADEVAGYLNEVAAALRSLPLDRLEVEKRILRTEAAGAAPGTTTRLLAHRVGLTGYATAAYEELGLRSLQPAEVEEWAGERFVRGACVVCWAGAEPPESLAPQLPDGPLRPPPPLVAIDGLPLPLAINEGTGGVAAGMVLTRGHPAGAAYSVAERRLFRRLRLDEGLAYGTHADWTAITAEKGHAVFTVECLDDHAVRARDAMLAVLDELAVAGPTAEELADAVERRRRDTEADGAAFGLVVHNAMRRLHGLPLQDDITMLEGLAAVAPEEAAAAMAEGLETMILLSPEDAPPPAGDRFKAFRLPAGDPVEGREFQTKGLRRSRRDRLVIGEEGLTLRTADDPEPLTVRWDDIAAATRERDGAFYITATNGAWLSIQPTTFKDTAPVRELLERHLDPAVLVPEPNAAAAAAVERLVKTTLTKNWSVRDELKWLPAELGEEERPLGLAVASRGMRLGLLVVTDRRVLFLYDAYKRSVYQHPLHAMAAVSTPHGLTGSDKLRLTGSSGEEVVYSDIKPPGRADHLARTIDELINP